MVYKPNIPQPTDNLSDSQGDLLGNFQQLDTSFGIDHYKFSDTSANNGFHNIITTPPAVGGEPATPAGLDKFFALSFPNIGLIQMSKGENNARPSPVSNWMSPPTASTLAATTGSLPILTLTGLNLVLATLYLANQGGPPLLVTADFMWGGNAGNVVISNVTSNIAGITVVMVGDILTVKNTGLNNYVAVYWALKLHRVN